MSARLLVELVPRVRVLSRAQRPRGDVGALVEVLPRDATRGVLGAIHL